MEIPINSYIYDEIFTCTSLKKVLKSKTPNSFDVMSFSG